MCWRHAPEDYAAVHFHSDDLYDCGWETDFAFTVPDGMPTGVYGARLRRAGHEDVLPFYVRPAYGRPPAQVLFIGSTYTFPASAHHARRTLDDAIRAPIRDWHAFPHQPAHHPQQPTPTYKPHHPPPPLAPP